MAEVRPVHVERDEERGGRLPGETERAGVEPGETGGTEPGTEGDVPLPRTGNLNTGGAIIMSAVI